MEYSLEELLPIVKMLSEKYTGKESTSITYESAEQLMEAVLYCIAENEIEDGGLDSTEVRNPRAQKKAEEAYETGYQFVLKKVMQVKAVYEGFIGDFKSYGNRNYYDTIVKGIPAFFTYYDAKFNPQDQILTLDYPTIDSPVNLCGVDAIYRYVTDIQLEQLFLKAFPEAYIRKALEDYHDNYEELYENICTIVLRDVIGRMRIEKNMQGRTKAEVEEELLKLLQILVNQGYQGDKRLFVYLKGAIKEI